MCKPHMRKGDRLMAMVTCKNCGKEISDKAPACPHCGLSTAPETPVAPEAPKPRFCRECGAELVKGAEICMNCGCPVPTGKPESKSVLSDLNINQDTVNNAVNKVNDAASKVNDAAKEVVEKAKANKKTAIIIAAVVVLMLVGVVAAAGLGGGLHGDDKIAYEMVLDAAPKFKDPSSVRLVSGTLGVDKDCMFCGISATNGFGARTTSYYFIMGGSILKEDDPSYLYTTTDDLHIEKINKKLEKALGSSY